MKDYKIKAEQVQNIAPGHGGCIASDLITVQGFPIIYMYRENPYNQSDSGWRFLSGQETDEYMQKSDNHSVYDVNTIANYDPTIVNFLDAPIGSEFEKKMRTHNLNLWRNNYSGASCKTNFSSMVLRFLC